jgi:hypothetical protein
VLSKQSGLTERLRYDRNERRSSLVRFMAPDAVDAETGSDLGDFVAGSWTVAELSPDCLTVVRDGAVRIGDTVHGIRAIKDIRIGGGRLDPTLSVTTTVTNIGSGTLTARFATEWSTMLLGGGGNPAAYNEIDDRRVAHDAAIQGSLVRSFAAGNTFLGIRLTTSIDPPCDVWIAPIETVSNSEGGFELVYQGSTALIGRVVTLRPRESATIAVEHRATVSVDRAVEEAATTA